MAVDRVPGRLEMAQQNGAEIINFEQEGLTDAVAAYEAFDQRQPGWLKVELEPAQ